MYLLLCQIVCNLVCIYLFQLKLRYHLHYEIQNILVHQSHNFSIPLRRNSSVLCICQIHCTGYFSSLPCMYHHSHIQSRINFLLCICVIFIKLLDNKFFYSAGVNHVNLVPPIYRHYDNEFSLLFWNLFHFACWEHLSNLITLMNCRSWTHLMNLPMMYQFLEVFLFSFFFLFVLAYFSHCLHFSSFFDCNLVLIFFLF